MPTPSFSKDITSLFNNSDLRDDLRYDITCRLVCENLRVVTVSMLMYDAKTDKLICQGKYIAPKYRSRYINYNDQVSTVIENISVFEFFDAYSIDFRRLSYEDFKQSIINGETNKHYKISPEQFDHLKWQWNSMGFKDIYYQYKAKLHDESYEIDYSSISGRYFSKLLNHGKQLTSAIEMLPMESGPQNGKPFFQIWEQLKIEFPKQNLYYIGAPIFATERYTGVLRITAYKPANSNIDDIFDEDVSKRHFQIERLNNFAQLISLHLKTNYYLHGYRTLSNLRIPEKYHSKNAMRDLDELCNTLTSVIKCNGCILRLGLNQHEQKDPPIRGVSVSLGNYKNYILNSSSAFSEDITAILKKNHNKEKEVKAINFSVTGRSDNQTFETLEYFYENDLLKFDLMAGRRFRDFTDEYIKDLHMFNMSEVVVLRLENVESGFLILSNTKNRKFTSSDIEMILLASKRIGLEIKHQLDTQRIREQEKIISQEENARLIVHQIGAPVRALSGHAQNLDDKIFKPHEVPLKISQLNKMSYALLRQLNSIQKYLDWEVRPIKPQRASTVYRIESYMRSRAIQFEGLTVGRKLRIWTIIENPQNFHDVCDIDKSMFDEIVNCLLDNAVKYSFFPTDLYAKGINFDPNDPLSAGHIHLKLNSSLEKLILTIENYGCHIDSNEYEKIFERGSRGKYGKIAAPVGSGIGLYLAKKVVEAFNGTIEVNHNKLTYLTQFTVTLKHEH